MRMIRKQNTTLAEPRLRTRGLGQAVPLGSNDTADGRQKNRRVEIRIQKQAPTNP